MSEEQKMELDNNLLRAGGASGNVDDEEGDVEFPTIIIHIQLSGGMTKGKRGSGSHYKVDKEYTIEMDRMGLTLEDIANKVMAEGGSRFFNSIRSMVISSDDSDLGLQPREWIKTSLIARITSEKEITLLFSKKELYGISIFSNEGEEDVTPLVTEVLARMQLHSEEIDSRLEGEEPSTKLEEADIASQKATEVYVTTRRVSLSPVGNDLLNCPEDMDENEHLELVSLTIRESLAKLNVEAADSLNVRTVISCAFPLGNGIFALIVTLKEEANFSINGDDQTLGYFSSVAPFGEGEAKYFIGPINDECNPTQSQVLAVMRLPPHGNDTTLISVATRQILSHLESQVDGSIMDKAFLIPFSLTFRVDNKKKAGGKKLAGGSKETRPSYITARALGIFIDAEVQPLVLEQLRVALGYKPPKYKNKEEIPKAKHEQWLCDLTCGNFDMFSSGRELEAGQGLASAESMKWKMERLVFSGISASVTLPVMWEYLNRLIGIPVSDIIDVKIVGNMASALVSRNSIKTHGAQIDNMILRKNIGSPVIRVLEVPSEFRNQIVNQMLMGNKNTPALPPLPVAEGAMKNSGILAAARERLKSRGSSKIGARPPQQEPPNAAPGNNVFNAGRGGDGRGSGQGGGGSDASGI